MTLTEARERLEALQKKLSAYSHAMGLLSYDGVTAAPKGTAANRGQTLGVLSEELYRLTTGPDTVPIPPMITMKTMDTVQLISNPEFG